MVAHLAADLHIHRGQHREAAPAILGECRERRVPAVVAFGSPKETGRAQFGAHRSERHLGRAVDIPPVAAVLARDPNLPTVERVGDREAIVPVVAVRTIRAFTQEELLIQSGEAVAREEIEPRIGPAVEVVAIIHIRADEPGRKRDGKDADNRKCRAGRRSVAARNRAPSGKRMSMSGAKP